MLMLDEYRKRTVPWTWDIRVSFGFRCRCACWYRMFYPLNIYHYGTKQNNQDKWQSYKDRDLCPCPDEVDYNKDVITKDEIIKTAHNFVENLDLKKINVDHKEWTEIPSARLLKVISYLKIWPLKIEYYTEGTRMVANQVWRWSIIPGRIEWWLCRRSMGECRLRTNNLFHNNCNMWRDLWRLTNKTLLQS